MNKIWNAILRRKKATPLGTLFSDGSFMPSISGGAAPWPTDPQAESYAAGAYDCHAWDGTGGLPAERETRPSDGGEIYGHWYRMGWNQMAHAETKTLRGDA